MVILNINYDCLRKAPNFPHFGLKRPKVSRVRMYLQNTLPGRFSGVWANMIGASCSRAQRTFAYYLTERIRVFPVTISPAKPKSLTDPHKGESCILLDW